jgi:hypothetical protein
MLTPFSNNAIRELPEQALMAYMLQIIRSLFFVTEQPFGHG